MAALSLHRYFQPPQLRSSVPITCRFALDDQNENKKENSFGRDIIKFISKFKKTFGMIQYPVLESGCPIRLCKDCLWTSWAMQRCRSYWCCAEALHADDEAERSRLEVFPVFKNVIINLYSTNKNSQRRGNKKAKVNDNFRPLSYCKRFKAKPCWQLEKKIKQSVLPLTRQNNYSLFHYT